MATTVYENNIEYAPFNSVARDRAINADHLARWLSSVNSDGVARKFDEFEATATGGMNVTVKTGIGFVDGHHIYLKSNQTIAIDEASITGNRIDTIGFRLEKANRKVVMYYTTGEVGSGVAPTPLDNDSYIEIPLYNVLVTQNLTSLNNANLQDERVYVVSSATYFKKYNQNYTTTSTTTTVTITTPFNAETDDISISVNGRELLKTQYSITGKIITFRSSIYSGNEIQVDVWHFQDGSNSMDDMNTVMVELGNLEEVKKYYYVCTGDDDNIALSNLAQSFLAGTGDFAGVDATAQMEIIVCGEMPIINQPYSGNGTQEYPYTYFAFGRAQSSTRTVYFNFCNCSRVIVSAPSTEDIYATILSGSDINIRNISMNVGTGYNVAIFNGQNIHCVDSEFWMTTDNDCVVGMCCGFFENVRTSITSIGGNAFGFYGNGRLLRIIGGTHYAYTANQSKEAVCFYVEAYQTENVLFISMANMPELSRSGYIQSRPVKINHGYCTILSCAMWMVATQGNGSFYSSTNCIAYGNAIISKN